jgi:hypothetical protein
LKFNRYDLNTSKEGLANVITIVFIIAIVMSLIIGPYLTIVVPNQIRKNESDHLDDVKESFLDLRAAISNQISEKNPIQNTRIKMGTDDENLFVLGGTGVLYFDPSEPLISIYSYYDSQSIYARGSGNIRYLSRNLYYPDMTYIYETGGVMASQRNKPTMIIDPDFQLTKRVVVNSISLDTDFGELGTTDSDLRHIYLINTLSTNVTFNKARISWLGGNATALTRLNIAGNPIEWTGSAASSVLIDFQNTYDLVGAPVIINLTFDDDIRDTSVTIELFTSDNREISAQWPNTELDTITQPYELSYPDGQTINNIYFKNLANRVVTIKKMAVSWTGGASLWKVEIPGHGGTVWDVLAPGLESPAVFNLEKDSIFSPDDLADVRLYFNGLIRDETINVKFFSQNSTNTASTSYPIDLNQTYINASLSIVTLISDKINTGGKSSKLIKTTLVSSEENKYIWDTGEDVIMNITTAYPDAWFQYLNYTLVEEYGLVWDYDGLGAFSGDYYVSMVEASDELTIINLIIKSINKMDCTIGIFQVELG